MNYPSVIYHSLDTMIKKTELSLALDAASSALNAGHLSAVVNSFFLNTKICVNGIPYIKISGLSAILRTNNSGAERPLIYQGIKGILAPSEIVEIDGHEHISGPSLRALIDTRIGFSQGKTKQYLAVAMNAYERILNLSQVRDLKDVFLDDIQKNRSTLKVQRITEYGITCCEFSNQAFFSNDLVEFAHISSVVSDPMRALDITNGVIILKTIHRKLTSLGIHDLEGMYRFCTNNNYSIGWTRNL